MQTHTKAKSHSNGADNIPSLTGLSLSAYHDLRVCENATRNHTISESQIQHKFTLRLGALALNIKI